MGIIKKGLNLKIIITILLLSFNQQSLANDLSDSQQATQSTNSLYYGFKINLLGDSRAVMRFKRWIDIISQVPSGVNTLWAISQSKHQLLIRHSHFSVISSGRTSAPMTRNLTNGVGEDVEIKFNAYIPEHGSHRVYGVNGKLIEFTAVQNLYHELAHAKHKMTGRWPYSRSEFAAIQEENKFRKELAELQNRPYFKRTHIQGKSICPQTTEKLDLSWGQDLICSS